MSYVKYPSTSAYAATPQTASFLGIYVHREVVPSFDDTEFTITPKYHLRPDLLAYDLYGNPGYFWIFLSRNLDEIRDVIWDFTAGKTIIIPSRAQVKALFG